ncbi:MAG: transcription-repair coupling factor [Clostridia bacterium]|jgi:transcription-repair coupling factor (superfamily II helicase)|nr:transcription-repair coupling factor [Clostridia bacterium]MCI1999521.1 transcription-repair coupling factor [Clostridia bacterium]MCI2014100.1 transcription-repair coupling factor [Clostridia bacterium]
MRNIAAALSESKEYGRLKDDILKNNTPVLTTGVIDVQTLHMISSVIYDLKRPSVIVAENDIKAKEMFEDMYFFNKNTVLFPSRDIIFYSADVHSRDTDINRMNVLKRLLEDENVNVVVSAEAVFDRLVPPEVLKDSIIRIKEGDMLDLETLSQKLILMGYERTDETQSKGQFSIRGGIIDIYPSVNENAVRIELWDDEVDSIRDMDVSTQRSVDRIKKTEIYPFNEFFYDEKCLDKAIKNIEKAYKKSHSTFVKKGLESEAQMLEHHVGESLENLEINKHDSAVAGFINYFYDKTVNIFGYAKENAVIYFNELSRIKQKSENISKELSESIKSRIEKGYMLPDMANIIYTYAEMVRFAEKKNCVIMNTIAVSASDFDIKDMISFKVRTTESYNNRFELFSEEVKELKNKGYRILIVSSSQSRGERLVKELEQHGVESAYVADYTEAALKKGTVTVSRGNLSKGFLYSDGDLAVFSDSSFLAKRKQKHPKRKKKNSVTIDSFADLKIGDYVVHSAHGIGVYRGIEKIVVDGVNKDYVKISYADGGNLFVPAGQMDCIQKYIGGNGNGVKVNKLGSKEWTNAKNKVRKAVEILAEDLIKLYAKRQAAKGFVYSPDNVWQREFEEMFPYEETEDQLNAIEEVKHDMETGRVMDRLICGDVGYGKTEVAIRAAFKAVQDSKQVVFLVPTTILAQQHYNTFVSRMKEYPIKIELLSRFKSKKEQAETIKRLESGLSDIVIGTHRILSKDVKFSNPGLVIIDEEQRFGVAHKEKLKSLKENIDVLTLTATPIPRTLHMSLSGIRDMSLLEEPPHERQPVQTYVMENDTELIRDAINRELARNGQVYYLYNRVESIEQETIKIQHLVPDANVAYAHGQMSERELEIIMKDFIEGEIDVLVCTTIIETGLDIGNVNTMIIQDADKMGLSQLYQLRGRVGRTNKVAYAYLMYKRDKVLNEVSEKRLQTIREFTEFGSGFKIAMRDLEIRGAGNILGAQQHGHMASVGYEMYCRLLDEAVSRLKGVDVKEDFETLIDINVNAYIPSSYIANEEQKLLIYKKIADILNQDDYNDIYDEITDRYGTMPKSVEMLLRIALLKSRAHKLDIMSVSQKQKSIVVTFKGQTKLDPTKITSVVMKNPLSYMFTSATNPYVTIKINDKAKKDVFEYITEFLGAIE